MPHNKNILCKDLSIGLSSSLQDYLIWYLFPVVEDNIHWIIKDFLEDNLQNKLENVIILPLS
jgi:hypothetical protein